MKGGTVSYRLKKSCSNCSAILHTWSHTTAIETLFRQLERCKSCIKHHALKLRGQLRGQGSLCVQLSQGTQSDWIPASDLVLPAINRQNSMDHSKSFEISVPWNHLCHTTTDPVIWISTALLGCTSHVTLFAVSQWRAIGAHQKGLRAVRALAR